MQSPSHAGAAPRGSLTWAAQGGLRLRFGQKNWKGSEESEGEPGQGPPAAAPDQGWALVSLAEKGGGGVRGGCLSVILGRLSVHQPRGAVCPLVRRGPGRSGLHSCLEPLGCRAGSQASTPGGRPSQEAAQHGLPSSAGAGREGATEGPGEGMDGLQNVLLPS